MIRSTYDALMIRTSSARPPYQISSDAVIWHTAIKNCVQQHRHFGAARWLSLLPATDLVRAGSLYALKKVARVCKAEARLHFALEYAIMNLHEAASKHEAASHVQPCSLSDADAVLCNLLLLYMLIVVLTDSQMDNATASTFRKTFAGVCGQLTIELKTICAREAKPSAQQLDFSSGLLNATVHQSMQYLKANIKHGAASVCPCMNFLLTLASSTPAKATVASHLVKQGRRLPALLACKWVNFPFPAVIPVSDIYLDFTDTCCHSFNHFMFVTQAATLCIHPTDAGIALQVEWPYWWQAYLRSMRQHRVQCCCCTGSAWGQPCLRSCGTSIWKCCTK